MISFQEDNIRAYGRLLWIEVAVRECIRHAMEQTYGDAWKKKIPGDLLKKIRESEREENRPHFNFIHLGPLYYLSLGELVPILRQKVASNITKIFGGEWIINDIEKILGPRNAICHARPVPAVGLTAIESLYQQVKTALESQGMIDIVATSDTGIFPEDSAKLLIPWIDELKKIMPILHAPIAIPDAYKDATLQYWWGNQDLAGFDCSTIDFLANLLGDYNSLPLGVGSAAKRQRFCEDRQPLQAIDNALSQLRRVSS